MGPLGTGRYASGAPSARVEGALADGIDLLSALQRLVVALAPPWDPRGAHAWRRRTRSRAGRTRAGQPPPAPLPGSTAT